MTLFFSYFLFYLRDIALFFSCLVDQLGGVVVMERVSHMKGPGSILGDKLFF